MPDDFERPTDLTDLDDIKEYFDESPDRGIAISLPAIIDNRITSILAELATMMLYVAVPCEPPG